MTKVGGASVIGCAIDPSVAHRGVREAEQQRTIVLLMRMLLMLMLVLVLMLMLLLMRRRRCGRGG